MKQFDIKRKNKISITISFIILFGFIVTIALNTLSYNNIIREDIKNISKLSSSNIYSEINNELIKPIFVSLTMANDSFLKGWLEGESVGEPDSEDLIEYLDGLKLKYDYNSVFVISEKTKGYYHYKGVHKTIDPSDLHDQWYYNFIESGKLYELDVDVGEAQGNALTVFVNCRIEDENNQLMGVVGVGLEMKEVQGILGLFEDSYDLESFLVDQNGMVQVHTNNQLIESYNINEDQIIRSFTDDIFANKTTLKTYRYNENGIDGYLITRYIEDLDWTLMVKKDTSILRRALYTQIGEVLIIVFIVILLVLLISNNVIKGFQHKMIEISKTDELTGLMNRRGFNQVIYDSLKSGEMNETYFSVYIFDIDNFKNLNDQYGHLLGDKIISLLANHASKVLKDQGIVSRWGGDEYVGIIYEDIETASQLISTLQENIAKDQDLSEYSVTISIGITASKHTDTPDIVVGRVDKGLYQSKEKGKNCISVV